MNTNTSTEVVLGLIRHALTVLGGALASKGYIDTSMVDATVGAIIIIIGTAWSVRQKLVTK